MRPPWYLSFGESNTFVLIAVRQEARANGSPGNACVDARAGRHVDVESGARLSRATRARAQRGMLSTKGLGRMLFFFFQAEDGIRDVAVTGVQTCALPI